AVGSCHRRNERGHRAFAVGAGYVHRRECQLGVAKRGARGLHARQPQLFSERDQAIKALERRLLFFILRPPPRCERSERSRSFISARGAMVSTMPCSIKNSER